MTKYNREIPHFMMDSLLPRLLSRFCESQHATFMTHRTTKFAKKAVKLEDGSTILGTEYDQHYVMIEACSREFGLFGTYFKLRYRYSSPTKKTLTLDKQYNPVKAVWKRKYHIKNEEVTKAEYEAYILSK